ncbi:MAG: NADH-quinone oxidoreductase subunit N [Candidatus Omnitrophica bacterium]|nr:NADH-quinone oxidoreductase subunit N [Candidatus Omnitrophota bacterium]
MNWPVIAAEAALSVLVVALLAGDLVLPSRHRPRLWQLALGGLAALAAVLWWQRPWVGDMLTATVQTGSFMAGGASMFVLDPFAYYFKWLFVLTAALVVLLTRNDAKLLSTQVGEFYLLLYTALLGMLVLASVNDLLLLFIGLELLTFSAYVMTAYVKTDSKAVEAGMKYLILGSVSSGCLIYGVGLLYGAAGSTNFEVLRAVFSSGELPPLAQIGLLLILAGLGFKIAAVPFHLWAPDVYEGAPTPVVALLSVGSKMAGVVALLRVLYGIFLPAQAVWGGLLAVVSAATLFYGNLAAIPQTNIKRLLGYSSIGHAGYVLMGLSTATRFGAQTVGFYLLAYLFSNLAIFFVITLVSKAGGGDSLDEYNGLSRRSPLLAAAMFIGLSSLAGVPPLAGFAGKWFVLLATVQQGRMWLVAIGAVNVAISLYYYFMVVRRVYVLPARPASSGAGGAPATSTPIKVDGLNRLILFFLLGGILVIGTVQGPFLSVLSRVINF